MNERKCFLRTYVRLNSDPRPYPAESARFTLRGTARFSRKADFYRPLSRTESLPRNGNLHSNLVLRYRMREYREEDGENTGILITLIPRATAAEGSGRSTPRRNYNGANVETAGKT